jgi:hypothetical protein
MPDNQESKELLIDMQMQVSYSDVATMPISLYERMKEIIKQYKKPIGTIGIDYEIIKTSELAKLKELLAENEQLKSGIFGFHAMVKDLQEQLTITQQALDKAVMLLETLPTKCYNAGVAAGILKDKAEYCFNDKLKQDYLERMSFWQDKFKELHRAALASIKE